MEKKIKILALFGKSAAGKDTLQDWIVFNYPTLTNKIVSYTTRPPRENELHGINYFFISTEEFTKKVLDGDILEATAFREWFYGTSFGQLNPNKINIGVFNIAGIETIIHDPRLEVVPIWVHASDKTRLARSLARERNPDCKEICRRFLADEKDFDEAEDFDYLSWINENNELHCSDEYRCQQLARILKDCSWANL